MLRKKKILIIGPPCAGKTTIKQVFFEKMNPFKLINETLSPTKGISLSVFTLWDYELGIFDLAGQENNLWFTDERDIFLNSNLIICVFDIRMYIKEIQDFFMKFIATYKKINLWNCPIVFFFHKVDLFSQIFIHNKIKAFKDFIKNNITINKDIIIYPTSIASDFFLDTFDYIADILREIFSISKLSEEGQYINKIRKDLEILITYDVNKLIHFDNLFYDFDLQYNDAMIHLKRLEKLGFLEISSDAKGFTLKEKTKIIKSGIQKNEINNTKINRILDAMYLFSSLNKKN
jgi:GTPase SAR1 family protein